MKDKNTLMPRGFGFVTFADPSIIDKVLENEHVIDGRTVEVKRTVPREEMPSKAGIKTKKIFVGGIPTSLTEDELKEHFSSYGEVVERQIMFDHATGRSRGFGFVTFKDEESVDKIISKGKMHDFDGKQVEIKRAEPKRSSGNQRKNERASYDAHSRSGSGYRANSYGYGGGQYDMYYGGGSAGYGYGRGYGYGGVQSYGGGYGANYGGYMYGGGGFNGGNMYGGPSGYGGWYGGYGNGRGGYGSRKDSLPPPVLYYLDHFSQKGFEKHSGSPALVRVLDRSAQLILVKTAEVEDEHDDESILKVMINRIMRLER
ncbi:hypothetical protein ZIOFF_022155 [Zingiber officinale]|nr:hypothetical protein ZIOFF_022155 [Zingiber officinale]